MALAFAPFGKEVTIVKIMADNKTKKHLENLGVIVGGNVTSIMDHNGSVILKIRDTRLALNKALALKIQVA